MAPRDAEGTRAARDWGFDMCALQDPRPSSRLAALPPTARQGRPGQGRASQVEDYYYDYDYDYDLLGHARRVAHWARPAC